MEKENRSNKKWHEQSIVVKKILLVSLGNAKNGSLANAKSRLRSKTGQQESFQVEGARNVLEHNVQA